MKSLKLPRFSGRAACAESDPETWFRDGVGGFSKEEELAQKICRTRCEIRDECLAWAMENREDFGIWGGFSVEQRKQLRRAA